MIERQIIIGLIVSKPYLQQVRRLWNAKYIQSDAARRIADWCWEYFDEFNEAPGPQIKPIFYEKLKNEKLPPELAEEIEDDILPSLSKEWADKKAINLEYLTKKSKLYFVERSLQLLRDDIEWQITKGKGNSKQRLARAEQLVLNYKKVASEFDDEVDFSNKESLDQVVAAFESVHEVIIRFPGALGEFWNDQMVRGGFVALLAPEKRGKTFWLMEIAFRAVKQFRRVAFFQAGDMTKAQQIRRMGIYLAKNSDQEKYCGPMWEPVADCIHNQTDNCTKKIRETDFGPFYKVDGHELRNTITLDALVEAYKENKGYRACHNCLAYRVNNWGTPWIKRVKVDSPLHAYEAKGYFDRFFVRNKRRFKLATYPNSTLTVSEIEAVLDRWEKTDGFVPDVIIIDYADLIVPEISEQFRHQQNDIWKRLRALADKKNCLVITATQADAKSYTKDHLTLENFSEDKRKFAHVTAMFGLNQDAKGREKKIGMMRINELVAREDDFEITHEVKVLHNLRRGRPLLTSYW